MIQFFYSLSSLVRNKPVLFEIITISNGYVLVLMPQYSIAILEKNVSIFRFFNQENPGIKPHQGGIPNMVYLLDMEDEKWQDVQIQRKI